MTAAIIVAGILLIGIAGIAGRSRSHEMSEWVVGERDFPRWTSWFLQAGESLTTFSFLGLAGIAFGGGVSASFAIAYLTTSTIGLYFVGPRLRQLGARRGYLTMADFFKDRFSSRTLSVLVAVVGAIFLIPYLQLQITGLGLIVQLATGSANARGFSMIVASVVTVVFVLWSGIRGIARVAVFKDIGMVLALLVVAIAVVGAGGGLGTVFDKISTSHADLLTTHAPGYDAAFWVTAVLVTTIGAGLNTFPHLWPPIFAADSAQTLRNNYKWLAAYQLLLFLPITVGLAAVLLIPEDTSSNEVLFTVSQHAMPSWLVALVAVCGAAAAIVPAAAISMGISSLLSHNVLTSVPEGIRLRLNHFIVVVAICLALIFGLRGASIGSLLLLTYGGLTQLAPAIAAALPSRVHLSSQAAIAGIVVGTLTVGWLTFWEVPIGNWDSGFIALGPNLVVTVVVELIVRARSRSTRSTPTGAADGAVSRR